MWLINRFPAFLTLNISADYIFHFHVTVVIAMLAMVHLFVLFYLRYSSYVSFYFRFVFQFEPAYG